MNPFYDTPPSALTVQAVINPDTTASDQTIVHNGDNGEFLFTVKRDGRMYAGLNFETSGWVGASAVGVQAGTWNHVAFTWDGENLRTFVNGKAGETRSTPAEDLSDPGAGTESSIGSNDRSSAYYDGRVDELIVSNRAEPSFEFACRRGRYEDQAAYYNEPASGSASGHWDFHERSGTTASDISGNSLDATLYNTENSDWVNGIRGKSMKLDGSNEYGSVSDSDLLELLFGVSIEAFVKTSHSGDAQTIFAKYGKSGAGNTDRYGYDFNIDANGYPEFNIRTDSGDWDQKVYGGKADMRVNDGLWHHLYAQVSRGDYTRIYVDGRLTNLDSTGYAGATDDGLTEIDNPSDAHIGAQKPYGGSVTSYFNGYLDEVLLYGTEHPVRNSYGLQFVPSSGGRGGMSFTNSNEIGSAGAAARSVVLADLDNDGKLDFISGSAAGTNELSIYQNDGTPFSGILTRVQIADVGKINQVISADLDNDGKKDLIVACTDGKIRIYQNDGTPFTDSWSTSVDITGGLTDEVTSIGVADIDKDGKLDIVAGRAGSANDIMIFKNPSSTFGGSWSTNKDLGSPGAPVKSISVLDLNNDGKVEIVSGQGGSGDDVHIWQPPSSAPFTNSWTDRDMGSTGGDVKDVKTIFDFKDASSGKFEYKTEHFRSGPCYDWETGEWDPGCGEYPSLRSALISSASVVSFSEGSGKTRLWENDDDYTFDWSFTTHDLVDLTPTINEGVLGDFDNDGDIDIAGVANKSDYQEELYIDVNNGGLPFVQHWGRVGIGDDNDNNYLSIAAADIDNDGDLDLFTGRDGTGNQLKVWENTLIHPELSYKVEGYDVGASVANVNDVSLGDLDADGDLDMVSITDSGEDYEVIAWQNDGLPYENTWTQFNLGAISDNVEALVLADLDQNGDLDVVIGSGSSEDYELIAFENDGTPFSGIWSSYNLGATSEDINDLSVLDVDRDGDPDLVTVCDSGEDYELIAWKNDGTPYNGVWASNDIGTSSADVHAVGLGDLDKDGDVDVVSGGHSDEDYELIAWQNDGTPFTDTWSSQNLGASSDSVNSVALGDLDQDGDLDVVSGSGSAEDYELIAWQNDGTPFTDTWSSNDVGTTDSVRDVVLADMDRDGDLDVTSGSNSGATNEVLSWKNDGTPFTSTWGSVTVGATSDNVLDVTLGDLDGDGNLDVVAGTGSSEDYEIIIWKNTCSKAGFTVSSTAPSSMGNSVKDDLLKVVVEHNGISGDSDIEVNKLTFLLEDSAGDPLTTAEAQTIFENLYVYYSSDGTWTAGDTPMVTISNSDIHFDLGYQEFHLLDGHIYSKIPQATSSKTYFLVAEMKSNAGSSSIKNFTATFDADKNAYIEDRKTDVRVATESEALADTGTVEIAEFPDPVIPVAGVLIVLGVARRRWRHRNYK